ncbi:MAG: hypothetical protein ACW964_05165 [Candidatus Hodarchaeales archaeon]
MKRKSSRKRKNSIKQRLKWHQKLENQLGEVIDQNSSIRMSINDLNAALNWFKVDEPSYDEIFKIAISNLGYVLLSRSQEIILKEITKELCGFVPLHDYVIMGFIKRGIIMWQSRTQKPIVSLLKVNPLENIQAMSFIFTYASCHICKAIYSRNKEWKEQLRRKIFLLAIEYYEEAFSVQNLIFKNPQLEKMYVENSDLV